MSFTALFPKSLQEDCVDFPLQASRYSSWGVGNKYTMATGDSTPTPTMSDATTKLWTALEAYNWDDVSTAVADGADVNSERCGDTGLLHALYLEAPLRVIEAMVEAGGDVHALGYERYTALYYASNYLPPHCEIGLAVCRYLLSKGVDHTKRDRLDGRLPIHRAAVANNVPVLRFWVEEKAVSVNVTTHYGITPLYLASLYGSLDVVSWLVSEGGADVDKARTDDGRTPLYIATLMGHLDIVRCLVSEGGADVYKATTDGLTPLQIASPSLRLLLDSRPTDPW